MEKEEILPYAKCNSQRIYYEDAGGPGPAIVFSHEILLDGTMFATQIEAFRERFRCIVWDARGHGESAADTEPGYSYDGSASDLADLLSVLDIDRAILVGVGMGAHVGMRCALAHPERVRALVLIGMQMMTDPATIARNREMCGGWIRGSLPDTVATQLEHILIGRDWPGAAAWTEKWRSMTASNLLSAVDASASRNDISHKISSINVPTLVIHGDADARIPLERAQAIKEAIPNAELVAVSGGRSVNMTNPTRVNAVLSEFLDRINPSLRGLGTDQSQGR